MPPKAKKHPPLQPNPKVASNAASPVDLAPASVPDLPKLAAADAYLARLVDLYPTSTRDDMFTKEEPSYDLASDKLHALSPLNAIPYAQAVLTLKVNLAAAFALLFRLNKIPQPTPKTSKKSEEAARRLQLDMLGELRRGLWSRVMPLYRLQNAGKAPTTVSEGEVDITRKALEAGPEEIRTRQNEFDSRLEVMLDVCTVVRKRASYTIAHFPPDHPQLISQADIDSMFAADFLSDASAIAGKQKDTFAIYRNEAEREWVLNLWKEKLHGYRVDSLLERKVSQLKKDYPIQALARTTGQSLLKNVWLAHLAEQKQPRSIFDDQGDGELMDDDHWETQSTARLQRQASHPIDPARDPSKLMRRTGVQASAATLSHLSAPLDTPDSQESDDEDQDEDRATSEASGSTPMYDQQHHEDDAEAVGLEAVGLILSGAPHDSDDETDHEPRQLDERSLPDTSLASLADQDGTDGDNDDDDDDSDTLVIKPPRQLSQIYIVPPPVSPIALRSRAKRSLSLGGVRSGPLRSKLSRPTTDVHHASGEKSAKSNPERDDDDAEEEGGSMVEEDKEEAIRRATKRAGKQRAPSRDLSSSDDTEPSDGEFSLEVNSKKRKHLLGAQSSQSKRAKARLNKATQSGSRQKASGRSNHTTRKARKSLQHDSSGDESENELQGELEAVVTQLIDGGYTMKQILAKTRSTIKLSQTKTALTQIASDDEYGSTRESDDEGATCSRSSRRQSQRRPSSSAKHIKISSSAAQGKSSQKLRARQSSTTAYSSSASSSSSTSSSATDYSSSDDADTGHVRSLGIRHARLPRTRRAWSQKEDETLLKGMEELYPTTQFWSKIAQRYGKKGTVNRVLKHRVPKDIRDRARNLKTQMIKEGKELPTYFNGTPIATFALYKQRSIQSGMAPPKRHKRASDRRPTVPDADEHAGSGENDDDEERFQPIVRQTPVASDDDRERKPSVEDLIEEELWQSEEVREEDDNGTEEEMEGVEDEVEDD